MEENNYKEIKENIITFLKSSDQNFNEENELIDISQIPSMSNNYYHVQIFSKETEKLEKEYLYKKFGEISECIDRETEEEIISHLAKEDLAPQIFYSDPDKKFRIEEFIDLDEEDDPYEKDTDSDGDSENDGFQSDIIDQIIQICLSYSLISKIYLYTMRTGENILQKFNIVIDTDEYFSGKDSRKRRFNSKKNLKNFFDFVVEDLYTKAMSMFNEFSEKAEKNLVKEENKDLFNDILLLKIYLTNFRSMVQEMFPKNGVMTLSHNFIRKDNLLRRKNYLKSKKKFIVIDHEYANLNLVGYDIVNYINESLFEYLPKYKFKEENYDFNYFYSIFQRYMEKFKIIRPELGITLNRQFNIDESEKYFIQLFCLNHLFWMVHSCVYLNFENYMKGIGFNFLQNAVDRIKCYEMGMQKLEELNEEEEQEEEEGFVIYV